MQYLIFLYHWTFVLALSFCGPSVFLSIYIMTRLKRKFDSLFKDRDAFYFFPRGSSYAGCIAYPTLLGGKKNSYLFKFYHGYNFRKDCNIVQIIIAWVYVTFGLLGGLLGVIHIGLNWLLSLPVFPQN